MFDIEPYYVMEYNKDNGVVVIKSYAWNKCRIMKQHLNAYGYLTIKLNGINRQIHSLIMECFGIKRQKGYSVNHIDGNKLNNSLNNLEYITIAENIKHAVRNGLHVCVDPKRSGRYKDGRAIKSRIKEYKREWYLKNKINDNKN